MTKIVNLRLIGNYSRKSGEFVYIGRGPQQCHMLNTPIGSDGWLGNPHSVHSREINIAMFKNDFLKRIESDAEFKEAVLKLKNKTLVCFCRPQACHGEVIAEFLDKEPA